MINKNFLFYFLFTFCKSLYDFFKVKIDLRINFNEKYINT